MLNTMRRRSESSQFPYRAQVLDRSFAILDVLAASTEDLSLADMGKKLNLHKSTFYRLLRTLERHRFAEKDFGTGRYRLGSKLLQLGARAVARFDLATIGRPYLENLSGQSGKRRPSEFSAMVKWCPSLLPRAGMSRGCTSR